MTHPSPPLPLGDLQSHRLGVQLRGRISELEAELAEQQHLKQQALDDGDFLRTELEELKKQWEDTEKAQRSLTEIESEERPLICSGAAPSPQPSLFCKRGGS